MNRFKLIRRRNAEIVPKHVIGGPIISVRDVHVAFSGAPVLRGVSLEVSAGERFELSGPSGAGKTTLFNIIRGVVSPDSGTVEIREHYSTADKRIVWRSGFAAMKGVGLVTQTPGHIETHSPAVNTYITSQMLGRRVDLGLLEELSEGFGLGDVMRRSDSEGLSGGQKARLSVIAALMMRPFALLMDEPAAGLSPNDREIFSFQLTRVCEERQIAVLAITHDLLPGFATHHHILQDGQLQKKQE